MGVRDVARQVNMIRHIPELSRYDRNPFALLPANMAMVQHKIIWMIMEQFCETTFAFKIEEETPSVGGFADVEDVIRVYNRRRAREYGGFWGVTELDNSGTENDIRRFLTDMGWTAGELADEYDRQHGSIPVPKVVTGNQALDDTVNDILQRHGKDAAIAYLNGLAKQLGHD